jgi:subtilase family serine protease
MTKINGSKSHLKLVGLAIFLAGFSFVFLSVSHSNVKADSESNRQHSLRAIIRHDHKAVCSRPRPGHASCTDVISTKSNGNPLISSPSTSGAYGPTAFHTAYNLPCTPGGSVAATCATPSTFGPTTIAIVDAGNFASGVSGLNASLADYDSYYGIASCSTSNGCLNVVSQTGSSSLPTFTGWSDEIALDVEAAHMVCQTCEIVLVEGNSDLTSDLAQAEVEAESFDPASISNSWSGNDETAYDSDFERNGIAIVAATGDTGSVSNGQDWPADIPQVTAASGTTLQLNSDDSWNSETVWGDSGGGCSITFAAPSWQTSLSNWSTAGCGSYKAFGDISADGDPNTGAAINMNGSWYESGGTSLSAPLLASIFALTGGVNSSVDAVTVPYANYAVQPSDFHDVTSGTDCTSSNTTHCNAGAEFDTPSGLGSPNGLTGFSELSSPSVSAKTISQTQINLSWAAITGASSYHVYRNNSQIGITTSTTYNDTGLTPNNSYSYYVVAYGSSGSASPDSSSVAAYSAYPDDINEDGHINLLDLSTLASVYGQCGSSVGRSDINNDGCVNLLDLSLLAQSYGSE